MSNLIILDSQGIDIILGMDWLKKYDGVIRCSKRIVELTNSDGTKVTFVAAPSTKKTIMLNQLKGTPMEEIRVVRDYPGVFPEELPGMPPDRNIEFIIDVVPRHHPFQRGHIGCPPMNWPNSRNW